jgi:TrmH family RNA methyltransferase
MGVDALLLAEGCDVWAPKVTRAAMGMNLQLPCVELPWKEVKQELERLPSTTRSRLQILLAVPDSTAAPYYSVDYTQPSLIVVGSEATGIGEESRKLGSEIQVPVVEICIPTTPGRGLESFNAAMAATVLLAEASKQRLIK